MLAGGLDLGDQVVFNITIENTSASILFFLMLLKAGMGMVILRELL